MASSSAKQLMRAYTVQVQSAARRVSDPHNNRDKAFKVIDKQCGKVYPRGKAWDRVAELSDICL
ncbi:hypothetical protein [Vibrio parahaemolyticus]|uniref:hypothetical protein n=1 Tax=Vibrio parahaemolyticus TaxID=670 RepID=UPI00064A54C9|nr:hypothetical protein [Vibrio parahaemolyticus]EII3125353.1 hypothetical protein [Vibrio parahaemolyticus]